MILQLSRDSVCDITQLCLERALARTHNSGLQVDRELKESGGRGNTIIAMAVKGKIRLGQGRNYLSSGVTTGGFELLARDMVIAPGSGRTPVVVHHLHGS